MTLSCGWCGEERGCVVAKLEIYTQLNTQPGIFCVICNILFGYLSLFSDLLTNRIKDEARRRVSTR